MPVSNVAINVQKLRKSEGTFQTCEGVWDGCTCERKKVLKEDEVEFGRSSLCDASWAIVDIIWENPIKKLGLSTYGIDGGRNHLGREETTGGCGETRTCKWEGDQDCIGRSWV